MFGWRAFEVYPLQVRVAGATPVPVPLKDHTHDLDAMLDAVTDRTRLIFVCNPNNPTSTVVPPDELARFVASVRSDILVAIDEAYVEYIRDGLLPDSLGLVREHPNVVVLRTFSKAYGLAGARVGLRGGRPGQVVTALGKVYVPFTASSLAQAAAIASIGAADELLARTDAVVAERTRVSAALRAAGYELPNSQANFVWLPLGPDRTAGLRRGGGRCAHSRAAVRYRRRAGDHRRAGRERRLPGLCHDMDGTHMTESAREQFAEFKGRTERISDAELDAFWGDATSRRHR